MKDFFINLIKGVLVGGANVIPGVSGGTMAMITGIFERLIHAVSALNFTSLRILVSGNLKSFSSRVDLIFLISLGIGILVSIFSISKILEILFVDFKTLIWAYFFGLIFASIFIVGRTIKHFTLSVNMFFIFGVLVAVGLLFINPNTENSSVGYLMLSGAIAMCSMILPGLSGSFILLIMGNYELIIHSVSKLNMEVLIPFAAGAIIGLLLFAKILSWVFRRYHDHTVGLLTGFIFGSLLILWPWKEENELLTGYIFLLPGINLETILSVMLIIFGLATVFIIESISIKK